MKKFTVSEDTEVVLNGKKYLLESGDKIVIGERFESDIQKATQTNASDVPEARHDLDQDPEGFETRRYDTIKNAIYNAKRAIELEGEGGDDYKSYANMMHDAIWEQTYDESLNDDDETLAKFLADMPDASSAPRSFLDWVGQFSWNDGPGMRFDRDSQPRDIPLGEVQYRRPRSR